MKKIIAIVLISIGLHTSAADITRLNAAEEMVKLGQYKKAHEEFVLMSNEGDSEAMHQLGLEYARGRGDIKVDNKKAIEWFSKSAMRGNKRAMTKLGLMHLEGRGTPVDTKEAMRWFQLAADREDPHAHYILSNERLDGTHIQRDLKLAYVHMSLAVRNQHPSALGKPERLAKMLTANERREADAIIEKRTPEDYRRKMQENNLKALSLRK
jgi:TPR repeat protein